MKLKNNHNRSLGITIQYESIVLAPGESADITEGDLRAIKDNYAANRWLEKEIITVTGAKVLSDDDKPNPGGKPDDTEKAIVKHVGGGHYKVFLNDDVLTEESLTKEEAEKAAAEYNADTK